MGFEMRALMMRSTMLALLACTVMAAHADAQNASPWREGYHYFLVLPPQPTNLPPGKVEVTEVFSYGCPACFQFYPIADKLKASLPPNAVMDYMPVAFNVAEDFPMFQRAYYTAQALGIADKAHDAMFNAVWSTNELATVDPKSHRLKDPQPSIEDAAAFYARTTGISKDKFLATASSFAVEMKMKRADSLMLAYQADSTPTIIVNGKFRLTVSSAGGYDQTIALVNYLVAKEGK